MSEVTPHPISLENLFFTRIEVAAVPDHEPSPGVIAAGPDNNLHVAAISGEKGKYTAHMSAVINPDGDKAQPYKIHMECMAVFQADNSLTEQEALRGVNITANSVLYGAIRESVSWLTGRQPYGPLLLGLSVLRNKRSVEDDKAQ